MYALIHHLDRREARTPRPATAGEPVDPATARASADPDTVAAVRRLGTLAAAALLAAAVLACGESDRTWGSTEAADRTATDRSGQRATPPPTPDYRELAAASGRGGDTSGASEATDAGRREPPLPRDVSFPEAESLYHAGDWDRALRHFRAYVGEHPDNPWGRYMLGLSAWKAGQRERAVTAFEAALQRDPDHVKSRVNLSRVLLELDRPEAAREHVRKALETAPRSAAALRVAGNTAHELGETDTALRRYRQALAVDGSDAWSANNLGLLLLRQGRYREALGPLARAAELRPDLAVVRNNLGAALERTGHLEAARRQYREAARSGHARAEASLARLEGVGGSGTAPEDVDLEALAGDFAARVEGWTKDDLARRPPRADTVRGPEGRRGPEALWVDPDGGSGPQDDVVPDSTSRDSTASLR